MLLRSLIFDHIWLKLFSLVLATLIWLAIRSNLVSTESQHASRVLGEPTVRKLARLPVFLLQDSTGHQPVVVEPSFVDVSVRGSDFRLAELRASDVHVFVRLTEGRTAGSFPVEVRAPNGITVFLITPASVQVKPSPPR